MKLGTLFADVREMPNDRCAYCGMTVPPKLEGDHLIPRHRGGSESADNLVWACKSCNSRKGAQDMLEWYAARDTFPPLVLMRRYLKLAIAEAVAREVMDAPLSESPAVTFAIKHIPVYYPLPGAAENQSCTCGVEGCSAFASFSCDYCTETPGLTSVRCGVLLCGDHVRGPNLELCPAHADAPPAHEEALSE